MEVKPLHIAIVLAALLVMYVAYELTLPGPAELQGSAALAQELYLGGVSFGENASAYTYSYTEYSNGFAENYTLESDGSAASVEVASALSDKKIYFLGNDTVLCVRFLSDMACSSVANETNARAYVESVRSRLFNASAARARVSDDEYLMNRSILVFSPGVANRTLPDGRPCSEIRYAVDYRNLTLQDMGRFGISASTPQLFQYVSCIGADGAIERLYFNYTYGGHTYEIRQELTGSDFAHVPAISPPQNLSPGAMDLAIGESAARRDLFGCYLQDAGAMGACVQKVALQQSDIGLCGLAGDARDRCYVSFMPYVKDPAVCGLITAPEFVDDCYIELAGAYKNATWCGSVNDASKRSYCLGIAMQLPQNGTGAGESAGSGTAAGNESGVSPGTGAGQNASGNESAMPSSVIDIFNNEENFSATNSTIANGTGGH